MVVLPELDGVTGFEVGATAEEDVDVEEEAEGLGGVKVVEEEAEIVDGEAEVAGGLSFFFADK